MMIELGTLANGPHAQLIQDLTENCYADERVQAIWVGGSLASGTGDQFSDVDFRIAVEPGEVEKWAAPDWERILPVASADGILMRFGEQALLHHLVLADGTILDFFVQDTERQNFEPNIVVLASRNPDFRAKLDDFARPAAPLTSEIDGATVRRLLVDYWIATHKQLKALARGYDLSPFVGLYYERLPLLRAWYMRATGMDIPARASLHMLNKLHEGLDGHITDEQREIMGMPSRTPAETVAAIEAIRNEMAEVGRYLADKHDFSYPQQLEEVARAFWSEHKSSAMRR